MPLLVTYRDRPIKRRRRSPQGLLLTFFSPLRGTRGGALVVTDDEWKQFGRIEDLSIDDFPDVRALARKFAGGANL
jgi:hypothetical protein